MLLVDWLLRTLALSTAGAPTGLQIALLAMVVVVWTRSRSRASACCATCAGTQCTK
jgi:hypothetical protein